MDHDIARVDQHPFAMAQPLDRDLAMARGFEPIEEALRQRHHLSLRAAAGDQQIIGDVGFSLEIDGDKVFGLAIFENLLGESEKGLRRRFGLAARFGGSGGACGDDDYLVVAAPRRERI